jgi:mono/diheme cytochrome c family protein
MFRPAVLAVSLMFCPGLLHAQAPAPVPSPTSATAAGKEVLQRKCFQCHQPSMWTSVRLDRKAWEGVLYRMVGRGALWTEAEIAAMAGFLAETRGPQKQ